MPRRTPRDLFRLISDARKPGGRRRKAARTTARLPMFSGVEGLESRTLMTGITANQSSAIIAGLQPVEAFGQTLITSGPLSRPLPIIDQSLGQVIDAHQAIAQGLEQQAESYLNAQGVASTVEGLLAQLNATTDHTTLGVDIQTTDTATATTNPAANALTFHVGFNATATSSPSIDLGAKAGALGLAASASAAVTAGLGLGFSFTVDDSKAFSLAFDSGTGASIGATVAASGSLGLTAPDTSHSGATTSVGATVDYFTFNPSATLSLQSTRIVPDVAVVLWAINWGDGPTQLAGNGSTATHTYAVGPNEYAITATAVTYNGSFAAPNAVDVVVNHAAPVLHLSGAAAVAANADYTLNLSSIANASHPLTAWAINWGAGGATETIPGSATSHPHRYATAGSYQITATATDNVGTYDATNAATSASFLPVQVTSAGPANLVVSAPASIVEGGTATLTGSFTDADATAIHHVTITWGDRGSSSFDLPAGTQSFSGLAALDHSYLDNPFGKPAGSYPVVVTVTNGNSGSVTAQHLLIAVPNAPPANVVATPSASRINEGDSIAVSGRFTDPGTSDSHTVDVNWGDGTADTILSLGTNVLTYSTTAHTYANNLAGNAPFPITVTVTDKDGASAAGGTQVEVDNLAPTNLVVIAGTSTANVGDPVSLSGTFADSGTLDAHTVDIDWGDNAPHGFLNLPAGATSFGTGGSVSHRYRASSTGQSSGLYAIAVTVADDSGARVAGGASVQFNGQTSTLVVDPASGTYGGTTTVSATLTSSAGSPLGLQPIAFSVGGAYVGTATTGPDGIARLSGVPLAGLSAATYASGITASFAGSPSIAGAAALQVIQAHLSVTASNQAKPYGAAVPTPTYTLAGFVLGQTLSTSGVTGAPSLADAATAASPVSAVPYAITAGLGTLAATNYDFSFVAGGLTITAVTPTVLATDPGGTYRGSAYPATARVAGFDGVALASLEGFAPTFTYYAGTSTSGSALPSAPSSAGTYTVPRNFMRTH